MATGDILLVEIRDDGWSADVYIQDFTLNTIFDFGTPGDLSTAKMFLTVYSESYDSSGTLGNSSRFVYGTKAIRKPYPNEADIDKIGRASCRERV